MKNDNELETLLPETLIKIGKKTVNVQPFPFTKLPRMVEIVKNIGSDIFTLYASIAPKEDSAANNVTLTPEALAGVADIIVNHIDDFTEIMAIYCRTDKAVFTADDFTIEDAIFLLVAIITRHKSFFYRMLAPTLKTAKG